MATKFKPIPVSGTEETEFVRVEFHRTGRRKGTLAFTERRTLDLGSAGVVELPLGIASLQFGPAKLDNVIPLYNPVSGDLIVGQTTTYGDLFTALYSAWRLAASKRDAGTEDVE